MRWRQRCGSGRNRPINQACQPPQPRVHPRHVDTPDKQAINPALKEPLGSIPFIQPLSHVLRPLYCMHMCARQRRGAHFSPINHAPAYTYYIYKHKCALTRTFSPRRCQRCLPRFQSVQRISTCDRAANLSLSHISAKPPVFF